MALRSSPMPDGTFLDGVDNKRAPLVSDFGFADLVRGAKKLALRACFSSEDNAGSSTVALVAVSSRSSEASSAASDLSSAPSPDLVLVAKSFAMASFLDLSNVPSAELALGAKKLAKAAFLCA